MPEGDTIFRTARTLNQALAGRRVVGFETGLAGLARVNDDGPLVGRAVEKVESRGKWCLMHFSAGLRGEEPLILVTHMRMNGSWHLYRAGEQWKRPRSAMRLVVRVEADPNRAAEPHEWGVQRVGGSNPTRAKLGRGTRSIGVDEGWEAVAFNVPVAEFHTERSLERTEVPRLGPDVLSGEFTHDTGVARLEAYAREHPEAEVGVVLLNQRVIAGLGNVYKSEVAFAARVNPWRAMRTLTRSEMDRLVEFAMRYMQANVVEDTGAGIVTYTGQRRTTGRMKTSDRLWVYKRGGQECRRCGTAIQMRKQGDQARVTFWCPECQV